MRGGRFVGTAIGLGAIAGAAAVLAHLISRSASAASVMRGPSCRRALSAHPETLAKIPVLDESLRGRVGSYDPDYPPEVWLPVVSELIRTDHSRVDLRVAMKWLVMESDGAPCALGKVGQVGPDGQPREIGLGQIYNPDDFARLGLLARGITAATFRAYCAPNSQRRTRRLTAQEMEDQVRHTLLSKIEHSMGVADRAVLKYGLRWSMTDYWKLVKSEHGWPLILSTGLPAVVKKLGRAPTSWSEFRRVLGMDGLIKDEDARSKTYGQLIPKYPRWHRGLNNAEELASVLTDRAVA